MTEGAGGERNLGRYLRPGADQRRLLDLMDRGHARARHGRDYGNPSADVFKSRIARHLNTASEAYAVDSAGFRCYLIVDRSADQVAWIPPHKERRATFFRPDDGVADYLATQARTGRGISVTPVDVGAARRAARTQEHVQQRAVMSARRHSAGAQLDR